LSTRPAGGNPIKLTKKGATSNSDLLPFGSWQLLSWNGVQYPEQPFRQLCLPQQTFRKPDETGLFPSVAASGNCIISIRLRSFKLDNRAKASFTGFRVKRSRQKSGMEVS
jgi:hypothetical protein